MTNTPDDTPLAKVLDFPVQAGDVIDHESVVIDQPAQGAPVDPPDEPVRRQPRRPIVPTWLRSRRDVAAALRWTLSQAGYTVAFHGLRLPK
jgi:S-DNA-T family DNA segregation ATPase FtsK/SpoIIIE